MNTKVTRLALLAVALLTPVRARAAGFALGEEGAAATGMVGAFTAKADDPSAIFYNPAGLADQHGLQLYLGGMLILVQPSATGSASFPLPRNAAAAAAAVGSQDGDVATVVIPNMYASYGFAHDVAVGVGLFTNFGLKVTWPPEWAGRFLSTFARLDTVTLNPSAAWRPVPWFAFGGGLDISFARVELKRAENLVDAEATVRFRGNDTAVGANVAVLFNTPRKEWMPPLSLGISYRSQYDLHFDHGGLTTANVPLPLSGILHDTVASATVPVPDLLSVGLGVRPIAPLFVQAQFDWANWSRLQTLRLTAPSDPQLSITLPEQWSDGYTLRLGAEYAFDQVSARVGVGYDWNPIPARTLSPLLPDSDRLLASAGVTVRLPWNILLEGALMGVFFRSRRSELPELPIEYSSWALLTSLSVSYRASLPPDRSSVAK